MKSQSEAQLQRLVMDWLRAEKIFALRMNVVRGKLERGGYVNQGLKGQADILVLSALTSPVFSIHFGRNVSAIIPIWLELKAQRGVQSEDQKLFEAQVKKQGHGYFVCRSLEDVKRALGR